MSVLTKSVKQMIAGVAIGAALAVASSVSVAGTPKTLCVWDPLGANGPIYSRMKDYVTEAVAWGIDFTMKPYIDERVAAEDFKSGLCDAVNVTGMRSRQFNSFAGTLDSIGAVPSYGVLEEVLKTISSVKAAKLMKQGPYEVVGFIPAGAVFMFVNDRSMQTVGDMSGKKMAVLENDPAQVIVVSNLGASPVASSIAGMYSKFNNGSVDITNGPALVYEAFELYKGLEPGGGIIRFPLLQLTLQILVKTENFPEGYGQRSRDYTLTQFDIAVKVATDAENGIDKKWWMEVPEDDQNKYSELLRLSRISLRDDGIYDGKMLKILRKLRCRAEPEMSECTAANKE